MGCLSRLRALAALGLVLAAAGCTTSGSPAPRLASAGGATVAFESIDGPPMGVFQKLVANLTAEAETRRVMVVSREGAASYRVRGYMSASITKGRTHIGWVWDVYDADKRRTLRITGEESAGRKHADAWSLIDDQMARKIARASMDRLVAFLGQPDAPPAEPSAPSGPRVAFADPVR
jgi:hypothetical protein